MNFDPFDDGGEAAARDEVDAIRRGDSSMSDAQAAEMLVDSVSGVMVSVATGGPEIKKVDASYKREHRALGAALKRLGLDYPNRYPDLWTWHGRWSQGDMPKYSDRRVYVADLFAPIREALADLKQATHELAKGVGDGAPTGVASDRRAAPAASVALQGGKGRRRLQRCRPPMREAPHVVGVCRL